MGARGGSAASACDARIRTGAPQRESAVGGRHQGIHGDDPPGQLRPLVCPSVSAAMLLGPRSEAPHLLGSFIAPTISKDMWCMLGDGLLARELLEAMLCTGSICSGEDSSAGAIAPVSSSGNIGGRDKTPTLTISSDRSSCCLYSRAFIEHISLLLQEKGSSEAHGRLVVLYTPVVAHHSSLLTVLSHAAAAYRVNPCTLWIIAHHRLVEQLFTRKFTSALTKPKQDVRVLLRSGSVGDTVAFFEGKLTGTCLQWDRAELRTYATLIY